VKTGEKSGRINQKIQPPRRKLDVVKPILNFCAKAVQWRTYASRPHCHRSTKRTRRDLIYEPFMAPILVTDITAESSALRKLIPRPEISYINAVSTICEASGADVEKVADGIGMDHRIGRDFLTLDRYGGVSCSPKISLRSLQSAKRLALRSNLLRKCNA